MHGLISAQPAETPELQLQSKGPFCLDNIVTFLSVPLSQTPHSRYFRPPPLLCAGYLPDESHNKNTTITQISSGHNDFHNAQPRPEVPQPLRSLEMQGDRRGLCDSESELQAPSLTAPLGLHPPWLSLASPL